MRATVVIGLLSAVLLAALPAARAAGPIGSVPGPNTARIAPMLAIQQGLLPLDRILPVVQRTVPGRVLDVQVIGATYRVKVLRPNGRVTHVTVDGRTGQVARVE